MPKYNPGQSGNPKGRPKGAKGKRSKLKIGEQLESMRFDFVKNWLSEFKRLGTPSERLDYLTKIAPYIFPKISSEAAVTAVINNQNNQTGTNGLDGDILQTVDKLIKGMGSGRVVIIPSNGREDLQCAFEEWCEKNELAKKEFIALKAVRKKLLEKYPEAVD